MSGGHVWRVALEQLRQEMTRAQFETWLRGTQLALAENGAAVLCVRTTFARELLETRFRQRIEAAIRQVTGRACALRIVVGAPDDTDMAAGTEAAPERQVERMSAHTASAASQRPRRAQAGYAGPALFAVAATPVESVPVAAPMLATPVIARASRPAMPNALPAEPAAAAHGRRPVASTPARKRLGAGARAVPATGRVRAAVERAASASGRTPTVPAALAPPTGGAPAVLAIARGQQSEDRGLARHRALATHTEHQGYQGHQSHQGQTGGAPANASPHGASAGGRMMNEHSDPSTGGSGQLPIPRLNPRYTFGAFIVGSGNQLAHAASQAVAEAPGQAYNPLFLYSPVGLGKTHLLHAIGHKALEMGLTVLYVSSETFTNEIINAIRYRTTEEFRAKYRSVDMLLVDDIQFIAGKDSTEEELFHTFNSLYEMSKQIVMCSDRPPKALVSLEERLRSRFEWGLIADIQPPNLETRVAILRAKADVLRRVVPDDVITYLASRPQSNIRELEGSFTRLLAYAQAQGLPLSIDTAKAALANLSTDGRERRVNIGEVLAAVAEYYRIPEDDLRGKQRDKHIVVPRQVAMYLMRQETEASLFEIGQSLGGRDHSTVLHGCEKITREVNENSSLRKEVLAIRQQLMG